MTMAETRDGSKLTARDREILRDVILTHILSGEPVSSRAVAKHGRLNLSAATIRNVMADLEEWGYLVHPHTSAGRLPTPAAYHLFIDSMMPARRLPARERRYIDDSFNASHGDAEHFMGVATHLLSELSQQVGIVVTPALGDTVLKAIEFIPVAPRKVLCVVVSGNGFVDSKVIEIEGEITREELLRISNYLTESFGGQSLREARDRLLRMMSEERVQMDRLLASAIDLAREGLAVHSGPDLLVDGASALLSRPELSDIQRVRRMFETFADKARLVQILNRCLEGGGMRVIIGEDSDLTLELGFSLVACPYGAGEARDKPLGTIGIFGPSRMEYEKVIPLVSYLSETLSRALAGSFPAMGKS
jgi:heat-inducible transcriptional repressor